MSAGKSHALRPYQGSYLTPAFEHATVADAMHRGLLACSPDDTLTDVARMMATYHVHSVAVIGVGHGDGERLGWGVVSDLDIVGAAETNAPEPTAGELAATEPLTVGVEEPLGAAAQLMREHEVHHLVVVSGEDPRPIGIISSLDIAGVIAWGRR